MGNQIDNYMTTKMNYKYRGRAISTFGINYRANGQNRNQNINKYVAI